MGGATGVQVAYGEQKLRITVHQCKENHLIVRCIVTNSY